MHGTFTVSRDEIFYPQTLAGINAVSGNMEQAEAFLGVLFGVESQSSLFNGFAVNREAFHKILQEVQEDLGDDEVYSSISMIMQHIRIRCPLSHRSSDAFLSDNPYSPYPFGPSRMTHAHHNRFI